MNGPGERVYSRKHGCLASSLPQQQRRRIGYWMSAKKLKKMDMAKFAVVCRAGGYELVQVDFTRPLEEQGPFDVFLHKLTDMIVKAEQDDAADSEAVRLFRVLESYMKKHPQTIVIDPIDNLKKLLLRHKQYQFIADSDACHHDKVLTPPFVRLLSWDPQEMLRVLRNAGVEFPIMCKAEEAHGSFEAHRMMIIFNADGLRSVFNSQGSEGSGGSGGLGGVKVPCVAQTFVNHDAVLYKVFVIGERFHIVRRPSFQNFFSTDLPPIVFDSQKIGGSRWLEELDESGGVSRPPIAASCVPDGAGVVLDADVVTSIVKGIRKQFGLSLIGIDLIVEKTTGRYAIIDVNAFPSYDGVTEFFPHLLSHIETIVRQRDSKMIFTNGHDVHLKSPAGLKQEGITITTGGEVGRCIART